MSPSTQAALSALRTILAFVAGLFVAKGWISADQATELVGAVIVLVPLAWGVVQKFQAEALAQKREVVAVQAGVASPISAGAAQDITPGTAKRIIATMGNGQPALALFLVCFFAVSLSACATNGRAAGALTTVPAVSASAPVQQDPLAALASFTVVDLQAALVDANAHGDQLAAMCYPALIQFVESLPSSNSGTTVVGAFTAFQKARDIRNTVSAGVPNYILIGCGPLVAQVRGDILTAIGRLGAGAATGGLALGVPLP